MKIKSGGGFLNIFWLLWLVVMNETLTESCTFTCNIDVKLSLKDYSKQTKESVYSSHNFTLDTLTTKILVNTSKLIVMLLSRYTISAKITLTNSKHLVQKWHLSLYGPPYASKKGFIYCWQQHMNYDKGPSNNGIARRYMVF